MKVQLTWNKSLRMPFSGKQDIRLYFVAEQAYVTTEGGIVPKDVMFQLHYTSENIYSIGIHRLTASKILENEVKFI